MKKFVCLILLFLCGSVHAGPADAVVRIPSHGGSGTVIATGDGWTLVLTCYHCFEGASRTKPIAIDMPHPSAGAPKKVGISVVALGSMDNDLALLRIHVGPVPYVTRVAPLSYVGNRDCWSVGFDEMKFPPQCRPAKIVKQEGPTRTYTDARPWHGRSGGALIEKQTGYLVGVVSAYTGPSNHAEYQSGCNGVYASLPAIHNFLVGAGVMERQAMPRQEFTPFDCPGGACPIQGPCPSCPRR